MQQMAVRFCPAPPIWQSMTKQDRERWERRERKQRKRKLGMKVSGKSVRLLLEQIIKKSQKARERREHEDQ